MASYYVWSAAAGSANGSSWANAYTTLTAAFSGKVAGDVFYVAHDHAESTGAAVTLTTAGTAINPAKVICANRSGSVPPVSADRRATATVTVTGSFSLGFLGCTHYDGIIFSAGNAASISNIIIPNGSTSALWFRFDNCSLRLTTTSATPRMYFGNSGTAGGTYVELNNTTVSFGNIAQLIDTCAVLRWRNTPAAIVGATIPTSLFGFQTTGRGALIECVGVDLSALGSGKNVVSAITNSTNVAGKFIDCKLDAAVTKMGGTSAHGSTEVDYVRSGASGNYTVSRYRVSGALTEETTIVRTGGANDNTTPIAWKIITTATCSYSQPFECAPIAIWNDTTGSAVTATVEGIWGGGAVPLDTEIWIECEFLGDASSPLGSFVADSAADLLTAGANQSAGSGTWGGSTTKFKLNVTFTPQQKGWIYARVKCARASSTFYVDPLITLT